MKIIFFAAFLFPFLAWSVEVIPPPRICSTECPETMTEIQKEFDRAGTLNAALVPFVVSGECYHQGRGYDPSKQQWGVVLMDSRDGEVYTGGAYAFFYKENPYSKWTVDDVRNSSPNLFTEDHRVYVKETFAFADMNKGGTGAKRWQFWYKQNLDYFYVMGIWGLDHALLCRMQNNPH